MPKFTIIQDSREQCPWIFPSDKHCKETRVKKLNYGDYSIEGLEDICFIEKKRSISEWSKNVTEQRFLRLLDNVEKANFKYKYIICSFPYFDILHFPSSLKISPRIKARIRITSEFIQSFTCSIPVKWNIPVIFFDFEEQAQKFTYQYLKWIAREEGII